MPSSRCFSAYFYLVISEYCRLGLVRGDVHGRKDMKTIIGLPDAVILLPRPVEWLPQTVIMLPFAVNWLL